MVCAAAPGPRVGYWRAAALPPRAAFDDAEPILDVCCAGSTAAVAAAVSQLTACVKSENNSFACTMSKCAELYLRGSSVADGVWKETSVGRRRIFGPDITNWAVCLRRDNLPH